MLREHRRQALGLGLLEHDLDAHELARDLLAQVADRPLKSSKASDLYSFSGSRWA